MLQFYPDNSKLIIAIVLNKSLCWFSSAENRIAVTFCIVEFIWILTHSCIRIHLVNVLKFWWTTVKKQQITLDYHPFVSGNKFQNKLLKVESIYSACEFTQSDRCTAYLFLRMRYWKVKKNRPHRDDGHIHHSDSILIKRIFIHQHPWVRHWYPIFFPQKIFFSFCPIWCMATLKIAFHFNSHFESFFH